MSEYRFRESLPNRNHLTVTVEFTCPPGKKPERILKFLADYEANPPSWADVEIAGVTVTHNPSGTVTASPSDVYAHIKEDGGTRGLSFIPHISAKGMNRPDMETFLYGLASHGVHNCFLITGDKPAGGKSVFELDSLNLLMLVRKMNADARVSSGLKPPAVDFFTGAGVALAKYEEGVCIQQMIKMEKKIRHGGAGYIITNLIYDPRKVEDLFHYMRDHDIDTPVVGNVFYLTEPAARRMRHEKLPGCFISEELYKRVAGESREGWVERCAQLVAMWRDLGASGVDLGNVEELELVKEIIDRALEIGSNWREYQENLSFPPGNGQAFYLYNQNGKATPLRTPSVPLRRRILNNTHDRLFEPDASGYKAVRYVMEHNKSIREGEGFGYEALELFETISKRVMAKCRSCGDCFLPENFFVCLMGECTKGLTNVPCEDSTADGRCGVDESRLCAARQVYDAARYFTGDVEALRNLVNPPKNPDLYNTSSFRNFFLNTDHHLRNPLIAVGEMVHTSLPRVKEAFDQIKQDGVTFEPGSPGVEYVKAAIESQALKGCDYLDCNVDDAGGGDQKLAQKLMANTIRLIVKYGLGTPPCIDSSDVEVLRAGLEAYKEAAPKGARPPLVNSANAGNLEKFWSLLPLGPFSVVYMLMESSQSAEAAGQPVSPDQMLENALHFFREAKKRGFKPEQIFYDATVMPLAIEFTCFDHPGFNYCAFEGMRRITANEEMKGVGKILGISNLIRDFPRGRKIGILRAYVDLAMKCGLTAGIVDVEKDLGLKPPEDEEIVEIVKAFVEHDGTPESYERMQNAYDRYRGYGGKN